MAPPDPCELVDLRKALKRFVTPSGSTQTSQHIKRLHWYTACRLVIEGGFHPNTIEPRPPFEVERHRGRNVLHHDPTKGGWGERIILGGLKTKQVDVSVSLGGIGPVLAISLKGTHNAFRNLTNRMEEAAGDCTNLHMCYPALVYGFWHVIRANDEADTEPHAHFSLTEGGRYKPADLAITSAGVLSASVARLAHALERLSDREDLRDEPSKYEACALTLVNVRSGSIGEIHDVRPDGRGVLDVNRMFQRLYDLYDLRFVYQAPDLRRKTRRIRWSPESPILRDVISCSTEFTEMSPLQDAEE